MATRRPATAPVSGTEPTQKLRQTQAEYVAARPSGEPGVKPMMSSSKMYVCRRCQANFKTGDGKPDARPHEHVLPQMSPDLQGSRITSALVDQVKMLPIVAVLLPPTAA